MSIVFKDQMKRTIRLEEIPRRIVSLVPSQTELLYDLGLNEEVVGITKFCIYPEIWFKSKQRIGGTKSLQIAKIRSLNPDLIIGNKEENTKEQIEELLEVAPVWMSDVNTIQDAFEMIQLIGDLSEKTEEANLWLAQINSNFSKIKKNLKGKTVLYFIWKDPDYVVGSNTFINAMIESTGLINFCKEGRYPEVKSTDVDPDFIFLSSEPFPFKDEHIKGFQEKFPSSKIILVDGEMFSWYGTRMALFPAYFNQLIDSLTN